MGNDAIAERGIYRSTCTKHGCKRSFTLRDRSSMQSKPETCKLANISDEMEKTKDIEEF